MPTHASARHSVHSAGDDTPPVPSTTPSWVRKRECTAPHDTCATRASANAGRRTGDAWYRRGLYQLRNMGWAVGEGQVWEGGAEPT
jgi:hypothetical protein